MSSVTLSTATVFAVTVTEQVADFPPAFAVIVAVPAFTAVTLPLESTVATDVFDELQLTALSVALSGVTVAFRLADSPSVSESSVLSSDTLSTAIVVGEASLTVTAQVADFSPALAVIVAVPAFTAVTLPLESTVATDVFDELQLTVLSVALDGLTVAVSVTLSPSVRLRLLLSSVTPSTATVFAATVTEQVADFPPALAVIVAVPAFTAVTFPLESTVATDVFDELQLTVLSVALSGFTVAFRLADSPSVRLKLVLSNDMLSTATVDEDASLTVTAQVADFSPALAVIVAVPAFTAVTLPFESTVATDVFDELQLTVLSVALSGFTVAVSVVLSPSVSESSVLSSDTLSTATVDEDASLTVTAQVADCSPALAVIVALPAFTAVTFPFESTVATDVFDELQLTVLSVALSGFTVAFRLADSPSVKLKLVLSNDMLSTATVDEDASLTVTAQVADFSPALTVIVAVPAFTAVTFPFESTVATDVSLEVQFTVLSVALSGFTVATKVVLSPSVKLKLVLSSDMLSTATVVGEASLTVTAQVADFSPALAVIVAVPAFTAVTFPAASTEAILASEEDQETVLSVALSGFTVAVSVALSPSVKVRLLLSSATAVTAMRPACFTVTI